MRGATSWPTAALYEATVRHARSEPVRNTFAYGGYYWLIDLDDPPRLPRGLGWLTRFDPRDMGGGRGDAMRAPIDAFLRGSGIDLRGGRILTLAHGRVLGHVFNPLTVSWCHSPDGTLRAVVAEVHNTYGDGHRYLLDVDARGRARVPKALYVSPFNAVDGEYRLALPEPGERLDLAITLHRPGCAPFAASVRGRRRPATLGALLRLAARHPVTPLVGAARIRWQGVRLLLRGLPLVPRPPAPCGRPPDAGARGEETRSLS
ncbi:hypothetical protein CLV63_13337 [Murinocardiopsis flavida]|uniref:DUF1365 family protein n=1 Tax=Murinocardiopsis flavida TaxID=645275 RepID=A0A2P8CPP3_9ACTN|nr:DUF1365 domain-containing protein [Murinocardiopsis flavida]PSK86920.1 hypothetical protein CLV63_13337 [Murinocardiopsis flavida]